MAGKTGALMPASLADFLVKLAVTGYIVLSVWYLAYSRRNK